MIAWWHKMIGKHVKRKRYQKESFKARMHMEKAAQVDIDARLRRLELLYQVKTRVKK